ncbi:hypothetical protein [Marinicella rhabdoformis]|uniref:hypothetical protein n=1 Tax=Marinicella rhabdoformis TaxID=2580566 RepID=UPI0012AEB58D|nr:hypothetical protein [Marinicella rhabdoformis]
MFKYTKQIILCGIFGLVLSACGGGSSDSGGASTGPAGKNLKITLTPVAQTLPANTNDFPVTLDSPFYTQVTVRVTFDNGTPIPDGTEIHLTTSNVQVAPISTLDDPETTDINEFTTMFGTIFNESAGGNGTFFIHSGSLTGSVTLTASAVDPQTGRTSFNNLNYNVTQGPEVFDRLTIEPQATTLPANVFGLSPREAFETVYMTEATISFRDPLGNYVNPLSDGNEGSTVGVAVSNTNVAVFSTLDDPETEPDDDPLTETNEIFVLLGSGPVDMVAGRGTIFIWAFQPGTATITVNALDQFTGDTISQTVDITVQSSSGNGPASIAVDSSGHSYINGSGGSQSQSVQVFVSDADGLPVANPNNANNILVDITTDGPNSGEFVSTTNAQGLPMQGTSVKLSSANGVGSLALHSGNNPNTVVMTVTTDRADNNVDNGLQDPITATNNFVISDGILFGLDITIPDLQNFFVNGVTDLNLAAGSGQLDGTYTMGVSVIGTDKGGNPALPQTIQFGLIDSPLDGFPQDGHGVFAISGIDGDPQEGGNQFTSQSARFFDDANGVQAGDTLLVWGEDIHGNEDLESSSTVQTVNSQTRLTISERFNRNDLTGSIINDMDIFPYAVGRALDGNIEASATLGDNGVATTYMNFPVSKLGKLSAIYAKGIGETINGVTRTVTDVETVVYPGLGSVGGTDLRAELIAYPSLIPANQDAYVTACTYDAAGHPLQGRTISWAFSGEGSGSIDGQSGSGVMNNRTGSDGCATGIARVAGFITQSDDSGFVFGSGSLTCVDEDTDICVRVANPGAGYLTASPSSVTASGNINIELFLFGGDGIGIGGAALVAECDSSGGILQVASAPTTTNDNGISNALILAGLNGYNESFSGTCTFAAAGGEPSVDVEFEGIDYCLLNYSPNPPPALCGP